MPRNFQMNWIDLSGGDATQVVILAVCFNVTLQRSLLVIVLLAQGQRNGTHKDLPLGTVGLVGQNLDAHVYLHWFSCRNRTLRVYKIIIQTFIVNNFLQKSKSMYALIVGCGCSFKHGLSKTLIFK